MTMAALQRQELDLRKPTEVSRVFVGVDDTEAGLTALAAAIRLARAYRVPLVAVRAWALGLPRHGGRRMRTLTHPHVILSFSGVEQSAAASVLVRKAFTVAAGGVPAGLSVRISTPEGDPGLELVRLANQPGDVIVLGTGRDHALRHLVHGSVSRYCAAHARCPVLSVPTGHAAPADSARVPGTD